MSQNDLPIANFHPYIASPSVYFIHPGFGLRVPRVTECPWQSSVSLCRVSLLFPSVPGNHRCPCAECPWQSLVSLCRVSLPLVPVNMRVCTSGDRECNRCPYLFPVSRDLVIVVPAYCDLVRCNVGSCSWGHRGQASNFPLQ